MSDHRRTVCRALALALCALAAAALAVAAPSHEVQAQLPVPAPHPTPTPANDGSIHAGGCPNGMVGSLRGGCAVDSTKCDPDAWNRYNAKEKAVRGIIAQWYAKEMSISEQEKDALIEFAENDIGVGAVKELALDEGFEKLRSNLENYFLDQGSKPITDLNNVWAGMKSRDAAFARAGRAATEGETAVEDASVAAVLVHAAELALYFEQIVNNADVASDENKKTLERADSLWQEALADLLQALSQNAACQKDHDAALAKEKLHDQAEAIIQKWEHNEHDMYHYNGETYDFPGALKKAAEIIQSGRQSSMRPDSPRFRLAGYEPRAAADTVRGYWLTVDQIQAAIAELELAQTRTRAYFAAWGEAIRWRPPVREQIASLLPAQPETAKDTGASAAGDVVNAAKDGAKQGVTDNVQDAAREAAAKAVKKILHFP